MRTTPRRWWSVFAAGTLAVLGGLVWLSVGTVRSEKASIAARAEADERAAVRLALWRLDAWLGGFLAREATRSYAEYSPRTPASPLTRFESDYIRLHFQLDATGELSSPRSRGPGHARALEELRGAFGVQRLRHHVVTAESQIARALATDERAPSVPEFSRRAAAGASCQLPQGAGAGTVRLVSSIEQPSVGPLVPLWLEPLTGNPADDAFIYVRRVEWLGVESFQGFLGDWSAVRSALLSQIADVFPEADLVPLPRAGDAEVSHGLATLPAALSIPPRSAPPDPGWTPVRRKLALVWLAAAVAVAAVGKTLHASIDFGRRRQRFAAAVAHELRTPLTTFQMYTEMLADGTIEAPDQRQEYLEILKEESVRLAGLMENVLTYSGLEEIPARLEAEDIRLDALLERLSPPLQRLAGEAGLELEIDEGAPPATALHVDVALVSRLLFNLIDNACKYAGPEHGEHAAVRLGVSLEGRHLVFTVRDRGPGIPRSHAKKVFLPFERGSLEPGDARPGAGLGLALARELARASGGDLTLELPPDGGACFELRLQAAG